MKIRSAMLSDKDKIASTHIASIETLCAGHYSAHDISGWIQVISPDIYDNAILEKIMIVAEEDDEILGLAILNIAGQEIGAVYVHPQAAGMGIGKNLLTELERKASENALSRLSLNSTTNASGFYRKYGYTGSEIGFHELPNGIRLKCIRMHKTLTSTP